MSFFSPFNCCLSVVLYLDEGDYPQNLHVAFWPNKQCSSEPFTCLDQSTRFLPAAVRHVVHFSVIIISFVAFLDGFIVRVLLGVLHFPLWLGLGLAFLGLVASVAICKVGDVLLLVHLTIVPCVSICRTSLVSTMSVHLKILSLVPSAKHAWCQLSVHLKMLPLAPSAKHAWCQLCLWCLST